MHEHPFDQFSVTLVGGTVRVTRFGKDPVVNQSQLGTVAFTPKGTIHMEELERCSAEENHARIDTVTSDGCGVVPTRRSGQVVRE
jgi:hypothetical protein